MKKNKEKPIKEEDFNLTEKKERLRIDKEDINVKKLESLIRLLEAMEPYEVDGSPLTNDKYPYRSILTDENKDIVIEKIFELILKY